MLSNWDRFDYFDSRFFSYCCLFEKLCFYLYAKNKKTLCSLVEKLCKRLSKNLRLCCEKIHSGLCKNRKCVIIVYKNRLLHRTVEKFYLWFFAPCSPVTCGFTQFPHSLLLQLLFLIRTKEVYEN